MQLIFVVSFILAFCFSTVVSAPPVRVLDRESETLESAVHNKINVHRARKGLDKLRWDERIAKEARRHSLAMARGKLGFGHTGFKQRIEATRVEFTAAAENVGQNKGFDDPADQAVEGWLASRGHRINIEGRYNLTGIGVARSRNGTFFFTQIFMQAGQKE